MNKNQRERRLLCNGCGRNFSYTRKEGRPPICDFEVDGPPASNCHALQQTAACRFHVQERRRRTAQHLRTEWNTRGPLNWVTIFTPDGELPLSQALKLNPATEATRIRRLLTKALRTLNTDQRSQLRAIGVVEPGIVEVRSDDETKRLVAMHAHLLIWGVAAKRLRALLKPVVKVTDLVIRPLKVTHAKTPAGALAYAFKHLNDHQVQVRIAGRKAFKRRPVPDELELLSRWSNCAARDTEILVGLRRNSNGNIASYDLSRCDTAGKLER